VTITVDSLSAELERLYDLSELQDLSATLLGLDPASVGGTTAKASFARALAERCVKQDAVDALFDAMAASHRGDAAPPRLTNGKHAPAVESELSQAGYTLVADIGAGPNSTVHRAYYDGDLVRLRIVRASRRDAQRYLVATRVVAGVTHPGLPEGVVAKEAAGSFLVSHPFVEGEPLTDALKRLGARHLNELLPLFWAIAEPLAQLHERRFAHGALHLNNILVVDSSSTQPKVVLLDAGSHLLRPGIPFASGDFKRSHLSALAPEILRGKPATPESDVYSFGVLMYQLLTGQDPFIGSTAADLATAHLSETPEPLSFASKGVGPEMDAFVQSLLEKEPEKRPRDGTELVEALRRVWRASTRPPSWVSDERLEGRFAILAEDPFNEGEASSLEASVDLGADPSRIAQGFLDVATVVEERGGAGAMVAAPKLLNRAARLFEAAGANDKAEGLYERLVELDPGDAASFATLVRLRRRLKKHEALIELLLQRTESAESATERAECYAEIGELYAKELGDKEQAIVAYAQAFCEEPLEDDRARAVERVAGSNPKAWSDVLDSCAGSVDSMTSAEARAALLLQAAEWYVSKLSRPDLALPLLNSVLASDPGSDHALAALAEVYRKAQQWAELVQVLARRADTAAPQVARDIRAEAADVLANRLSNPSAAEELCQAVLTEDPGHEKASEALASVLRARGDQKRALEVLEARAMSLSGESRHGQLLQIAEGWEIELDRLDAAERIYRTVLKEDPRHLDALRGLDRVLNRAGRFRELVEVLKAEIELAVTPRQKVGLYERIAGLYDEEYLDPALASEALEQALALDGSRSSAAMELARHYRRLDRWDDLEALYSTQIEATTDRAWKIEAGMALSRLLDDHYKKPGRAIEELERVLDLAPEHAGALSAMASLRARVGDAESAIAAIERLAEGAKTSEEKAEHFIKAADMLLGQGDGHGAIRQLKRAIDTLPEHPAANKKLLAAYVSVGSHSAAVELLEERLSQTSGESARGAIAGQIALITHRFLNDDEKAMAMSQVALHLDPTNLDALRVQGRVAYSEERYVEAAKRLEGVVSQGHSLPDDEVVDTVFAYIDSLAKSGAADRALQNADQYIKFLNKSASSLLRLCELSAEHGTPQRTVELVTNLLEEHSSTLSTAEEGIARRLGGEALIKLGRHRQALGELEQASRLAPESRQVLTAIADAYMALGDFRKAIDVRRTEIELVDGDERVKLLVDLAEIAADKLNDTDYAGRCLLMALGEAPNDRRILARLMQLFSAEKDWPRLLEVVTRLADLVDDPKQKAKYLHTAAMVAARELKDAAQALDLLDQALAQDATHQGAMDEALAIRRKFQDFDGIKDLLKQKAQSLAQEGKNAELLPVLEELGAAYEKIGNLEQAARVYESALEIEPDGVRWVERLAQLYSDDPGRAEQATEALSLWIEVDPYRPEPYQLLRKVHTGARSADGAWTACQALHVLGQAQPDESRFFSRFRGEELVAARRRLTFDEWTEFVTPNESEPLITSLFAIIQPYVLAVRSRPVSSYSLGEEDVLDMDRYPHGLVYALYHGSQALPAAEPAIFQRQSDPGRITPLATPTPAVVLGQRAFAEDMGPLQSAFVAGLELAHTLPGLRLRTLLPNMTMLKAWLLGAIRMVKPRFPVAAELEQGVAEAAATLQQHATGEQRDYLVHAVSKLLQDGAALDLKRWVRGVDQAADRAGLILCGDLEVAATIARNEVSRPSAVEGTARARDLLVYSVSPGYLAVRERLAIGVNT
jgi:tetratricopeptide (TPR) repeat protein